MPMASVATATFVFPLLNRRVCRLRISGGRLNITSAENGVAAIGYGGWEGNVLVEGGTLAVACRNTAVLYSHRTSLPEKQVSFLCPQPMRKLSPYASPS